MVGTGTASYGTASTGNVGHGEAGQGKDNKLSGQLKEGLGV